MLTEKHRASAIKSCDDDARFTQMSIVGGSSETEQTAVMVRPPRALPDLAATTDTLAANWRIAMRRPSAIDWADCDSKSIVSWVIASRACPKCGIEAGFEPNPEEVW